MSSRVERILSKQKGVPLIRKSPFVVKRMYLLKPKRGSLKKCSFRIQEGPLEAEEGHMEAEKGPFKTKRVLSEEKGLSGVNSVPSGPKRVRWAQKASLAPKEPTRFFCVWGGSEDMLVHFRAFGVLWSAALPPHTLRPPL